MLLSYEFDLRWVTDYFRKRWVTERSDAPIVDLREMIMGLTREEAIDILTGKKALRTMSNGYEIVDDDTQEIDGQPLDWENQ
jgi:hypothetical protein